MSLTALAAEVLPFPKDATTSFGTLDAREENPSNYALSTLFILYPQTCVAAKAGSY
jgi:hypothetical protein